MSFVIGIDVGTSGTRALVVDEAGQARGIGAAGYPLRQPRPGWAEQDPGDWWRAVCEAIGLAVKASGASAAEIGGLALSGQMHGAVLLDKAGRVVRPPILWCDTRTTDACRWIDGQIGSASLLQATGNLALEGFTAPKLVWLAQHEPASLARSATLLLPKDYINYLLTGERVTEMSDAAGTLLFDVAGGCWAAEVVARLGVPAEILPPVVASHQVIGALTPAAAAATGLAQGTPVACGGADNACGAIGAGVLNPGQALSSIGSSGVVLAPVGTAAIAPHGELHLFNHAAPGRWYLMGVMLAAGLSYRWFRDELGMTEVAQGRRSGVDPYTLLDRLAASVPAGAGGVVFLPYLNGERTPHADANARGVFFGLSASHRRAHLARSVMEGITFGLHDAVALMRALGHTVARVRAIGGGARSPFWLQMQADVLRSVVEAPAVDEGPAYGAALLAAVGVGRYRDVAEAAGATVKVKAVYEPDDGQSAAYAQAYAIYRSLYPALKEIYARAARGGEGGLRP